ncbi:MAG: DUF4287 domain-containing protein [Candidatus Nanopelagicaceae bacterium]
MAIELQDLAKKVPARDNGSRQAYFPKIEAKYGQPMRYWFAVMKDISDLKYPQQISYLREEHGFSQAHANALVMYSRGSKSSKRFEDLEGYLKGQGEVKSKTIKKIFKVIQKKYPKLELVIAWNQPMLKMGSEYLFGASILKNHILIAPWNPKVLSAMKQDLQGYKVNKKTLQVPIDWKVDEKLLLKMIKLNLQFLNK